MSQITFVENFICFVGSVIPPIGTLETPLVAAAAVLRAIGSTPADEIGAVIARLRDRGEQVVRGRSNAVHIWTWDGTT